MKMGLCALDISRCCWGAGGSFKWRCRLQRLHSEVWCSLLDATSELEGFSDPSVPGSLWRGSVLRCRQLTMAELAALQARWTGLTGSTEDGDEDADEGSTKQVKSTGVYL